MSVYVPAVRPLSAKDIEQQALVINQRFYPALLQRPGKFPVLDFFDLLRDEYRLDPGVEELSDGVEGMTWPDGRVIVSEQTYRGAFDGRGRPRFTVVHEAYHGIQHRTQIERALVHVGRLVLHRRQTIEAYRDPEWQANTFASAVLMPEPMVRVVASRPRRMPLAASLAKMFGVSASSAEVRLKKLGIV